MNNRKKKSGILLKTAVLMIAICLAAGIFIGIQLRRYEKGVLDVCAVQQDGYVQLVLDQINLKDNRSDTDMIRNILGTLDDSSSRYWTFSKGENMLFVKDVLETNKYKGLSADSYYAGRSASNFLSGLQEDTVTHALITLNGKQYVASGAAFSYKKSTYKLVLLTNCSVILDSNPYLGAKTASLTVIAALLILLILVPMILAWRYTQLEKSGNRKDETIGELSRGLAAMDKKFSQELLHKATGDVWSAALLPEFLQRLQKRGVTSAVTAVLAFDEREKRDDFIRTGTRLLERKFLLFEQPKELSGHSQQEKAELILLFAEAKEEQIRALLRPFESLVTDVKSVDLGIRE